MDTQYEFNVQKEEQMKREKNRTEIFVFYIKGDKLWKK